MLLVSCTPFDGEASPGAAGSPRIGGGTAAPVLSPGAPVDLQVALVDRGTGSKDGVRHSMHTDVIAVPEDVVALSAPDAPRNVTASAGEQSARVSWTAPSSDGGGPILDYRVTVSPGGATHAGITGTSTVVSGLRAGTAYTFTVAARNSVGYSAASTPSNSVTPSPPLMGADPSPSPAPAATPTRVPSPAPTATPTRVPSPAATATPPSVASQRPDEPVPTASSGPRPPEPSTPPQPAVDEQLREFVQSCEEDTSIDLPGQVDYPRSMQLRMGVAKTYDAAVDVREVPAPPGAVISAEDPTQEPVTVQCLVAARLVPVGDGIDVGPPDDAVDGGWVYQAFPASGVVEWAWSVTPRTPQDQQLRLELRPAVKGKDVVLVSSTATASYVTPVRVAASTVQRVSFWFRTDWPLLAAVVGMLGAALLALLQFSTTARDALSKLTGRSAQSPPEAARPQSGKTPAKSAGAISGAERRAVKRRR
jgi:hypothetical protein